MVYLLHCLYGVDAPERKERAEKYIQLLTTLSLTILVFLHLFSCCVRNLRNSEKFEPIQFEDIHSASK